MKKIILSTVAMLAFGFANAQEVVIIEKEKEVKGFSKGDMFLEGAFSIKSQDINQSNGAVKSNFGFNPKFGYMFKDNQAVGAYLTFGGSKFYGTNQNGSVKTATFGGGAFYRYYFLQLGKTKAFNAYGELGAGYSGTRGENAAGDFTSDKYNGYGANIDLGLNYFFTDHFAVSFILANIFSYNSLSPETGDNGSSLNVNLNVFNNFFDTPSFSLIYKW